MTEPPVPTTQIAALLDQIRQLADDPTIAPATRADVLAHKTDILARKADLLARLVAERADEWTGEQAQHARLLAQDAQALAAQARAITKHDRPDT